MECAIFESGQRAGIIYIGTLYLHIQALIDKT